MKSFVILGLLAALTGAQRPFYAGTSQKVYPELANRFKDTAPSTTTTSTSTTTATTTTTDSSIDSNTIANRIGEDNSQTDIKIPIDARGDYDLVQWLNSRPRPNRPFWVFNPEQIESFGGPEGTRRRQQPVQDVGVEDNKNKQQKVRVRTYFGGYVPIDDDGVELVEQKPVLISSFGRP